MPNDDDDVYRKLQQHLDQMPIGFPATKSGVEIRLLKFFFTPEEAEIALLLDYQPEPLKRIYKKVKKVKDISIEQLEAMLDGMLKKGSLNGGKNPATGEKFFAAAFLAVGMFEYQINRLTPEFVKDFEQYMEEAFIHEFKKSGVPQLRTVPIEQAVEHQNLVATYDDVRKIIETRTPITVAPCICRKAKKMVGKGCEHLSETCLQFGTAAYIYKENGLGREITKDEALAILKKGEDDGLVLQPGNSQKPGWICMCCGCCCEVLTNAKKLPNPGDVFSTNHVSSIDTEKCIGCGTCVDRCPMEALKLGGNDKAEVNPKRCIGCGVCVPACPESAIKLIKRGEERIPPATNLDMYMRIMEGKAKALQKEREQAR
ncbi:MAG: 4Fe-4S binding protein [Candidatus Sigynarchaeum springense]